MKIFSVVKTAKLDGREIVLGIERINADYMKLENGHLIFRKFGGHSNSYPETTRVFAPGTWREVELVS